jgi:hypothetical protein
MMNNENLKKSTIGASKIVGGARPAGGIQRGAYGTMALGGAREKEASSPLPDSSPEATAPPEEQPTRGMHSRESLSCAECVERGFIPQFTRAQARKTDDDDSGILLYSLSFFRF